MLITADAVKINIVTKMNVKKTFILVGWGSFDEGRWGTENEREKWEMGRMGVKNV
jgi:hypothetical protein